MGILDKLFGKNDTPAQPDVNLSAQPIEINPRPSARVVRAAGRLLHLHQYPGTVDESSEPRYKQVLLDHGINPPRNVEEAKRLYESLKG